MNTFNLALIFERAAVAIIVCASESPIDEEMVHETASNHLQQALLSNLSAKDVVKQVVNGIKQDTGYQVVKVEADAACMIVPRNGIQF